MRILLNGKTVETDSQTLKELIIEHEIPLEKVAIEVNGEIVPKSQCVDFILKENMLVEIITFVGGG